MLVGARKEQETAVVDEGKGGGEGRKVTWT
jgi:hypothetical protein